MVARTPASKEKRRAAPPQNSSAAREIVKKVDRCVARLQELQYTVAGGSKTVAGSSLSPRSTRGYLRTNLRCKQEAIRMKNSGRKNSEGEWKGMSLQAMLVGETVKEILQAKERVAGPTEPRTPTPRRGGEVRDFRERRKRVAARSEARTPAAGGGEVKDFRERRKREKEYRASKSPPQRKAKGRIRFSPPSPSPPPALPRMTVEIAKKTVMFPNAAYSKSPSSVSRMRFVVKSQRSPVRVSARGKVSAMAKMRRSFSPARLASRLATMSPLRRASRREEVCN